MKVEVGKTYWTRGGRLHESHDGGKFEPMKAEVIKKMEGNHNLRYPVHVKYEYTYGQLKGEREPFLEAVTENGRFFYDGSQSSYDLMREVEPEESFQDEEWERPFTIGGGA